MNLTLWFGALGIFSVANGLGALLATRRYLVNFGLSTDDTGLVIAHYFGGLSLGAGVLLWLARHAADPMIQQALLAGLSVRFATGAATGLSHSWSDRTWREGRLIGTIDLVIALASIYFLVSAA